MVGSGEARAKANRATASTRSIANGALRRRYPAPQDSPSTTAPATATSRSVPLAAVRGAGSVSRRDARTSTTNSQRVPSPISSGRRTRIHTRARNADSRAGTSSGCVLNMDVPSRSVARLTAWVPWLCVPALRRVCPFVESSGLHVALDDMYIAAEHSYRSIIPSTHASVHANAEIGGHCQSNMEAAQHGPVDGGFEHAEMQIGRAARQDTDLSSCPGSGRRLLRRTPLRIVATSPRTCRNAKKPEITDSRRATVVADTPTESPSTSRDCTTAPAFGVTFDTMGTCP